MKHLEILECGKKNAERADLLPFPSSPAPAIFQFPFSLPFSHFLAVSTRVELPRRREVSNDLTEHSRFRSPSSHVGLYRRCLPVEYPFSLKIKRRVSAVPN